MPCNRLLLVEDDAALQQALERYLTRCGYAVEVAGSLAEARACIATRAPQAIVLDLELPDGFGGTLATEAPEPVIVISVCHPQDDRLGRSAVAAFLRKPFRFPALRQAVAAALHPKRTDHE